jgi:drug/metabolite transporter (DMT)-like permease
VNPVVAVVLGWAFLSEPVTLRTLLAGLVVVGAVALIVTARAVPPGNPAEGAPDAECLRREGREGP